ncbi:MAG TPA: tRNA (adenosine(37)-N6)-dimethylallyltransferase MiaA [Candidatus Moranbacteria bacterium]|nr:tRNA (adenosine(37)-N6)-dimethylallyltransferase MiaA [Candidatus Moranbacteria bacterium]
MESRRKIIIVLGPTSSGKSDVAIRLARKFNGEIISADSRQIYKGMDIGTGKVPRDSVGIRSLRKGSDPYISAVIPHYLIDIINPKTNFSAAQFKKKAEKIIEDIIKRGKTPIICGGTGFWIKAVVDNVEFPEVKPDRELRKRLGKESAEKLFLMLQKLDPERSKNIDAKNPVRLIRAIEICKAIGKVPKISEPKGSDPYGVGIGSLQFLQIGIDIPKEKLHGKIKKRLDKRWEQGMIKEIKELKEEYKLSWKKIQSFGLGYYWIPLFLQNKISKEELHERVYLAEKDYAKRQMTWFKRDKRIKWLKNYKQIEAEAEKFLN